MIFSDCCVLNIKILSVYLHLNNLINSVYLNFIHSFISGSTALCWALASSSVS
jgi:hypothetical protein